MNRNFTRLVCALAALILISIPIIGQVPGNTLKSPLRIDESTADSLVIYKDSGERISVETDVQDDPPCWTVFDLEIEPGTVNEIVSAPLAGGYYGHGTAEELVEIKYNGPNIIYIAHNAVYASGPSLQESYYDYNEKGQIVSREDYSDGRLGVQYNFTYNENGDLMYYECIVGSGSGGLDHINSTIYEFDSQGRRSRVYSYREQFLEYFMAPPLGKHLQMYAIYYYPDATVTPGTAIENNTPIGDTNEGSFDLNVNIPVDSISSGSVTVNLPEGLTLDETNTTLAVDVAGLFDLTITKQEGNTWLIAIKLKPSSKSGALKADEALGTMLHVAYKVEDTLPRGTYNISVNSILFETPHGNMIPEPAIIVPANINRWATGNERIESPQTEVYIAGNTLHINTPLPDVLYIYTAVGVKVFESPVPAGASTISTANFPQGMLILKGKSGWVKKVVK